MPEQKTQQFSKFYLKAIKNKLKKNHNKENLFNEFIFST